MTDANDISPFVRLDMEAIRSELVRANELERRWREGRDTPARWQIIRDAYDQRLPRILKAAERGYSCDPYFLDWDFTPIERLAWMDIRGTGMPLYPQFPVGNCFIDFADPYRKIGVELDGREFHEESRDRARDMKLWSQGWRIFRIPGYKSLPSGKPIFDGDWQHRLEDETGQFLCDLEEWAERWSEGIFWAIDFFYLMKPQQRDDRFWRAAINALEKNRLVPFCLELDTNQLWETI